MFTRLKGVKLPVWVSVTFLALWEDLEVFRSPVAGVSRVCAGCRDVP